MLKDRPVLYYALKAFQDSDIDSIVLAAGENDLEMCRTQIVEKYGINKVMAIVAGGAQRYDTVYNALKAAQELAIDTAPKEVLIYIHDGARPCISREIIKNCEEAALQYGACTAAVPVKDTIKVVSPEGFAVDTPDRNTLWQIQTPQVFRSDIISSAYAKMYADTDRGRTLYGRSGQNGNGRIHKYKNYNAGRHGDCGAVSLKNKNQNRTGCLRG